MARVSSPVVGFEPVTATATTASGRKYHLVGSAVGDNDALYAFEYFLQINRIDRPQVIDVSDGYLWAIVEAEAGASSVEFRPGWAGDAAGRDADRSAGSSAEPPGGAAPGR